MPLTASPAPSTSRSSSPLRTLTLPRTTGLRIGLARPRLVALSVGLDVELMTLGKEDPKDPMVGDDVAELVEEPGIAMGIAIGSREFPFRLMGDPKLPPCASLKCDSEGETARRFEAEG